MAVHSKSGLLASAHVTMCVVMALLSLPEGDCFSAGGLVSGLRLGGRMPLKAGISSAPRVASASQQGTTMQLWDWVPAAAAQQQRDPARLMPLKPLPSNIVIRMASKKAQEPFEGIMERLNPGDFGPDMKDVVKVGRSRAMAVVPCTTKHLPLALTGHCIASCRFNHPSRL